MKIFEIFECSGQILSNSLCQFWNEESIPLQIFYLSSVSWKLIPLYFFGLKNIYFAQKEPLKWKFLRFLSAQVKFCQISYANFETRSRFLSKFCISVQFHERLFLCTFLAQRIYTLLKRSPLKRKFLRFSSARVKIHQIRHPSVSWKITPLYFFRANIKYFAHFSL